LPPLPSSLASTKLANPGSSGKMAVENGEREGRGRDRLHCNLQVTAGANYEYGERAAPGKN